MERLTTRNSLGHIVLEVPVMCQRCGERDYNPVNESGDLIAGNLLAYEATSLTPERCAELAQAEREGRLVVLPEGTTRDIAEWMHGLFEKWNPIIAQYAAEAALQGKDGAHE